MTLGATITDACGVAPGSACRWVWDRTHNETLAKITDWLVARPLRIALILLGAYIVDRLVRRAIRKLVERITRESAEDLRRGGDGGDRLWLERIRERDERARQRTLTLGAVLRSGASVIVFGLAALLCLGELDISLGPLIAGAGVAGIALGFGAQSLVRDFLAGIFIVLEDQYGVGDTVNLGEASGTVEKVTLRTTALRDIDGTLWVVPNGEIRRVANRSQRWARAVLDVRIDYDADLDRSLEVARQTAASFYDANADSGDMLEAPEVLGVESFLDGAAVLRITVKTEPGRQFVVARAMRVALKQGFDAAGIRALTGVTGPPPPAPPPKQ